VVTEAATLVGVYDSDEGPWQSVPPDDAPELDWVLFRQDNVLSLDQAVRLLGASAVRTRLRRGRWQKAGWGVLAAHNGPLTRGQQIWAATLGAGDGAFCAGATAATLEGLRGFGRGPVDLLIPASRRVRRVPGARVHRSEVLPADHLVRRGLPHTVMARAIVDAAAWARTDDDARAVVAAAFQQGRVTADGLAPALELLTRSRRRALVAETARYAAAGAHSLSEVDLVRICRRFGLPVPEHQVPRADASGRTRYLDAYWRRWGLHVEVDGSFHLDVRTWWADMRRQNELWISGDRVLRFPAWVVLHRPTEVATQLETALRSAGWSR
jgi:hypothetical protein